MVAFRDELALRSLEVAVIASDPLIRAGLAASLSAEPLVHVTDRALPTGVDVVVWEGPVERDGAPRWRDVLAAAPVVALVGTARAAVEALTAGAHGVLDRESSGARVIAAARAVVAGLTVLGPGYEQVRASGKASRLREPLTPREREVLALLVEGRSNPEIGERLGISEHTAKFHVNQVLAKLGVQRRVEAVVAAARLGLISL